MPSPTALARDNKGYPSRDIQKCLKKDLYLLLSQIAIWQN